jgi:hypothetical protein
MRTEVEAKRALHVGQAQATQYHRRHREKQSKVLPLKLGTPVHTHGISFCVKSDALMGGIPRGTKRSLTTLDLRLNRMN